MKYLSYKKSSGFSLIEFTIAMAIGSVLLLIIGIMMFRMQADFKTTEISLDNTATKNIIMRMLIKDIRGGGVSMNNLTILDDNGETFFDYFSNIRCPSSCSRTLTLKPGVGQLILMVDDASANNGRAIIYPPEKAYTWGSAVPGGLQYVSLNSNLYLDSLIPDLWSPGRALLLSSSVVLHELNAATGFPVMTKPAKPYIFLGTVNGTDLAATTIDGVVRNSHPIDPAVKVTSADQFLRTLPPSGGQTVTAYLKPVSFVQYRLDSAVVNGVPSSNLVQRVWNPDAQQFGSAGFTVGANISQLTFKRSDVSSTLIYFYIGMTTGGTQDTALAQSAGANSEAIAVAVSPGNDSIAGTYGSANSSVPDSTQNKSPAHTPDNTDGKNVKDFFINIVGSCAVSHFAVANFMAPSSRLLMRLKFKNMAEILVYFSAESACDLKKVGASTNKDLNVQVTDAAGMSYVGAEGSRQGNTVRIRVPGLNPVGYDVSGNRNWQEAEDAVEYIKFEQVDLGDAAFSNIVGAKVGVINTLKLKYNFNPNGDKLNIRVKFPGQKQYCMGGN